MDRFTLPIIVKRSVQAWLLLALLSFTCNSQAVQENVWGCGQDEAVLKDKRGMTVWLTPQQLKRLALNVVNATLQGQTCITHKVEVSVDVYVDAKGNVECSRVEKAHPLLRSVSLEAVRKWSFKPTLVNGNPVGVFGRIVFYFQQGSREGVP
jgi:TonB-like protein